MFIRPCKERGRSSHECWAVCTNECERGNAQVLPEGIEYELSLIHI